MQKVVGIRFKKAGKIYYFDPENIFLKLGDNVIVETARGLEYGIVSSKVKYVSEEELKPPVKPVIRKATQKDTKIHEENLEKAKKALQICKKEVEKQKLDMKLIRAEYTFNANKVIFYFTADGRIDFRELVKNLAGIFRIRIELRQIGVRDEAKILGGVGPCGCGLCCNKWLGEFEPVSIKMAKEQGLSLNPSKISGMCGRLLCCLQYEYNCYEDALSRLPSLADRVNTPDGEGTVERLNILKETFLVKFDNDGDLSFKEYTSDEIKVIRRKRKNKPTQENILENVDIQKEELENLEKQEKEPGKENTNSKHNQPNNKKQQNKHSQKNHNNNHNGNHNNNNKNNHNNNHVNNDNNSHDNNNNGNNKNNHHNNHINNDNNSHDNNNNGKKNKKNYYKNNKKQNNKETGK